jgi:ribosome-binding protein aMBF1 (putative translation factor)
MTRKNTHTRKIRTSAGKNALEILDSITGDDLELQDMIAAEGINAQVAQIIHDARRKAGLSQKELAELVGTKQPVIARLEKADYEGHSLSMLQRIATALDRRVDIRLMPRKRRAAR